MAQQQLERAVLVVNSWTRAIKIETLPVELVTVILGYYHWKLDETQLVLLDSLSSRRTDLYGDGEWLFAPEESTHSQELCIEFDITMMSTPGDIFIGVRPQVGVQPIYVFEGLYGSLIGNNKRRWNYMPNKNSLVFITDMDDAVLNSGSCVQMVLQFNAQSKQCAVKYIIDGTDHGFAWTDIPSPVQLVVIMKPDQLQFTVLHKYHKYLM